MAAQTRITSPTPDANGGIQPQSTPVIKPGVLKSGDTVGIIAPSSPVWEAGKLDVTIGFLQDLGLKHKLGKHIFDSYSDYAGVDSARLEDLHGMWADPEVTCILPVRGGNGAVRLLPHLDFDLIAKNPKILIGYSDLTGLILPIFQKTGLVTFHGPMSDGFFRSAYTYLWFRRALMRRRPLGLISDPPEPANLKPHYPPPRLVINQGIARGRLIGGCMTLIRQLMGTPYQIQTEGRILFLEDLDEEPHSIDRTLSQLHLAGLLQKAAGIIIGECANCDPGKSGRRALPLNCSLESTLRERLGGLNIPVVYGMRFGHLDDKFTLPLGVMASLKAFPDRVRFKIEETATV